MTIAQHTSGINISCWFNDPQKIYYPTLDKNLTCEICIIGAGITGLTTAYQLVCQGKSVIILEDGNIASGESGRTSAHLSNILDDRFYEIEKMHGFEIAQLASESHAAAIQFIENICQTENIDCEFERLNGYLFLDKISSMDILEKEYAITKKLGLSPQLLKNPIAETFKMDAFIQFPHQAQFHPIKYLSQLAKIITAKGGKIFENTKAIHFNNGKSIQIHTHNGMIINADNIVFATNVPINNKFFIHTKQEANRTYIVGSLVPKGSVKSALYWDTAEPYHYIRVHKGNYLYGNNECDLLIIGGEDHRTGVTPSPFNHNPFRQLEAWSNNLFPQILQHVSYWSGQIIEPIDYLAFIGPNIFDNKNCFIATGDSGNGLTHGTLGGILIADLILHNKNEWEKVYKTSRKSLKSWHDFININLKTMLSYSKYFTPKTNIENILPGEGAVINKNLSKIAVYKDNDGKLYKCSAVCPHLKAIVQWNPYEKTWDCPAHGSRFSCTGEVVNGPANKNLCLIKCEHT